MQIPNILYTGNFPEETNSEDAARDAVIEYFAVPNSIDKTMLVLDDIEYMLNSLERVGCYLGFETAIPKGYYFQVIPRSGLALWDGLTILNTPGTIDSGYRNQWMAIVVNLSAQPVTLHKGDRICQIVLAKKLRYTTEKALELPASRRGLGGFGSTGT